jgi:hypothetical protein
VNATFRCTYRIIRTILAVVLLTACPTNRALAQDEPPTYSPDQLDKVVARIALYPDPLLAQILAAATFPDQISDAAAWADQHHYLTGDALAAAVEADHLPWDPSVQALLPFPSVLEMMANDMTWTTELGNAFLNQRQDVMDAVQRMRQKAKDFGYLRSNAQVTVTGGPFIEILPANPAFICVPYYDPLVVFAPPRPGIVVGAAIRFRFGVTIGAAFAPWGWDACRFDWGRHVVIINNEPWRRVWVNRAVYVHPYHLEHWAVGRRVEPHRLIVRTPRERAVAHLGHPRIEVHHRH